MIKIIIPLVLLASVSTVSLAADLAQGVLTATGFGIADGSKFPRPQARLMSKRAATVDAQRNLMETIEGVRVTAGTTVENMVVTSDKVGTRVQGMLQGAFIVNENTYEDTGSWVTEMELGVCVNKSALECQQKPSLTDIIREEMAATPPVKVFDPTNEMIGASLTADEEAVGEVATVSGGSTEAPATSVSAESPAEPATGLIVDVSGQDFSPMLDVRIETADGAELYGPALVQLEDGTDWLNWARSVDAAKQMSQVVGDNPLVVAASGLSDSDHIVVSNDQAIAIFNSNTSGSNFLKKGKVIFVVK